MIFRLKYYLKLRFAKELLNVFIGFNLAACV